MALDKDILGNALYTCANNYNDVDIEDINAARLEFWKGIADVVINHFKTNGEIPGLGLTAGATAVTGITKIQ